MTGVSYTFNLGPVTDVPSQHTQPISGGVAESHTGIATSYESAVAASLRSAETGQVVPQSSENIFIVHSDGPGVTTLSIGEEDGLGDYLSLPVVDGAEFLEPPIEGFGSVAEHGVTTLAIGEEDGGYVETVPQIAEAPSPAITSYESVAFEPLHTTPTPVASPVYSQATMQPIYSPGDNPPPASVAATVSPGPAVAETLYLTPRAKPVSLASGGAPIPGIKPGHFQAATVAPEPAAGTGSGGYVSVGDYDSYIAGIGSGEAAIQPASISVPSESIDFSADLVIPESDDPGTVSAPLSEETLGESEPVEAAPVYIQESVAPDTPPAPQPEPVYRLDEDGYITEPTIDIQGSVPAGEQGGVTGASTRVEMTFSGQQTQPVPATATSVEWMSAIETPLPGQKPEASTGTPTLSEEDFRITTLALGEEEAGGG